MVAKNPTRVDLYERYQAIVQEYNKDKDAAEIQKVMDDLFAFNDDCSEEEKRYLREGLDSETELAVFDLLQIDEMQSAQGALRHGALYDLINREGTQDVRSSMVDWLAQRFGTDKLQTERVSRTAQHLLQAMMPSATAAERDRRAPRRSREVLMERRARGRGPRRRRAAPRARRCRC